MTNQRNGRVLVYPNQTPFETDVLYSNMYNMVDAAYVARAALGQGISNGTLVSGIPCVQNTVPDLSVLLGAGVMFSFQNLDATSFSSIPADTAATDNIYKPYIQYTQYNTLLNTPVSNLVGLPLALTPPGSGTTNYLIQATNLTVDTDTASRPYFNPTNPANPTYISAPQTRWDTIFYGLKSATSPTIPTPDAGYVGLYVISVPSGTTAIINSMISVYSAAPFITETLTQKVSYASLQASTPLYGVDTGSANIYAATAIPAYGVIQSGTIIRVKIANTNTGASTLAVSGLTAYAIRKQSPVGLQALVGGELVAGLVAEFQYDGTYYQLLNPATELAYSASIYNASIAQSISAITDTVLQWDTVEFSDPYGAVSIGTLGSSGNNRLIANVNGLYDVTCYTTYTSNSGAAQNNILSLFKNGSIYSRLGDTQGIQGGNYYFGGTQKVYLNAGDYIQATINITQGGSINNGDLTGIFQLTYLGN